MNSANGITILNAYSQNLDSIIGIISWCIIIVVAIVSYIISYLNRRPLTAIVCAMLALISGVILYFIIRSYKVEYHYDVCIDDTVSFNYIYDKYIIDGKDGEIYHLIIRDAPEEAITSNEQ